MSGNVALLVCPCVIQMLFDADGKIKKYAGVPVCLCMYVCAPRNASAQESPKDILQDFAQVRMKIYEKFWAQGTSKPR